MSRHATSNARWAPALLLNARWAPALLLNARWALALLLAMATAAVSCKSRASDSTLATLQHPSWTCEGGQARPGPDENPCGEGKRFVKGQCGSARCDDGDLAPNCCPGMLLCTAGGACQIPASSLQPCTHDAQCAPPMRCLQRPYAAAGKSCGYLPVQADGTCPEDLFPFNQRCVANAPCGGVCAPGSVCNIETDRCETPPTLADPASCAQSCAAGDMLVYANPDTMIFDGCCAVACACQTLPPLPAGSLGRFASIAVASTHVLVASYSDTYGDLVLTRHNRESGHRESMTFVDGLPSAGPIAGNATGIRGGLAAPGPDVGTHASLQLNSLGEASVVYLDLDHHQLKLAQEKPGGIFVTSTVDQGLGDVGRYASLVIDQTQILHVAYLAHGVAAPGGGLMSTPVYAVSSTPAPSGPSQWRKVLIDPVAGCDGLCDQGHVCVSLRTQRAACEPVANTCGNCACDETCVATPEGPRCGRKRPSGLANPAGGGLTAGALFISLGVFGDEAWLVYYDRPGRHLRGAVVTASGSVESFAVACEAGEDLGQHASLARAPDGTVGIAFQGGGGSDLRYFHGASLREGTIETIDNGVRPGTRHWVGAYASLRYDAAGRAFVIYGDQTKNDVCFSHRDNTAWATPKTLEGQGAFGSFADLAVDDTTGYAAFVRRERRRQRNHHTLVMRVIDASGLAP